jgi:choline dehydrogenase
MVRDYATAAPLSKIIDAELAPGAAFQGDDELRAFVRNNVATLYHPVGTCAMGGDVGKSASGFDSVVDPQLRVRGVPGLRIVDASVMPTVPRGNTNAPVIAIAERAADLIAGRAPLAPQDPTAVTLAQ